MKNKKLLKFQLLILASSIGVLAGCGTGLNTMDPTLYGGRLTAAEIAAARADLLSLKAQLGIGPDNKVNGDAGEAQDAKHLNGTWQLSRVACRTEPNPPTARTEFNGNVYLIISDRGAILVSDSVAGLYDCPFASAITLTATYSTGGNSLGWNYLNRAFKSSCLSASPYPSPAMSFNIESISDDGQVLRFNNTLVKSSDRNTGFCSGSGSNTYLTFNKID